MDVQHLLCGIGAEKLRNLGFFKIQLPQLPSLPRPAALLGRDTAVVDDLVPQTSRNVKPCRRHLPVGTGPFTVGCVDLMSDHTVKGVFIRLYYPTNPTDIYVSTFLLTLYWKPRVVMIELCRQWRHWRLSLWQLQPSGATSDDKVGIMKTFFAFIIVSVVWVMAWCWIGHKPQISHEHGLYAPSSEVKDLWLNTLRPRQNGCLFADDIFKRIFLNENVWISITILFLRVQLTIFQHWFR